MDKGLKSIGKGITFAFKDEAIRTIFIVIMLMNFLAIGIIAFDSTSGASLSTGGTITSTFA